MMIVLYGAFSQIAIPARAGQLLDMSHVVVVVAVVKRVLLTGIYFSV